MVNEGKWHMLEHLNFGDIGEIKHNLPVEPLVEDAVNNG